jgi:uncharacterized membrane protein HdeD (DUF308 family)
VAYVPRAADRGAHGVLLLTWPSIGLVTLAWITGIFLIVDAIYQFVAALSRRTEHRGCSCCSAS